MGEEDGIELTLEVEEECGTELVVAGEEVEI